MAGRLQDKVAIVTGAGSIAPGLGQRQGGVRPVRPRGGHGIRRRHQSGSGRGDLPHHRRRGRHRESPCHGRHQQRPGEGHGGRLHGRLRPHRHPAQQRRRLRARRPGGHARRRVRPADRIQPEKRLPDVQALYPGDGKAGRRRHHQRLVPGRRAAYRPLPFGLWRGQGGPDALHPDHGGRVRAEGHPLQHGGAGPCADAPGRAPHGAPVPGRGFSGHARSSLQGHPHGPHGRRLGRGLTRLCTWPPTRPRTPPASTSPWTAASA